MHYFGNQNDQMKIARNIYITLHNYTVHVYIKEIYRML